MFTARDMALVSLIRLLIILSDWLVLTVGCYPFPTILKSFPFQPVSKFIAIHGEHCQRLRSEGRHRLVTAALGFFLLWGFVRWTMKG